MPLIDDPHHGGDAYRYVDAEKLKAAAPELLQACLQAYLTIASPVDEKIKDHKKIEGFLRVALKSAGHPAGEYVPPLRRAGY